MDISIARGVVEQHSVSLQVGSNVRPTSNADLDVILPNLALRTLREIDLYLADVPEHARLQNIREHVEAAISEECADTFCADGIPVGIITHTPEHDYFYTTALPTEAYFCKAFLRLSRRYNDALVQRLGSELRAYSRSDSPNATAWFRLMGFEKIGTDNEARVFAYTSNDCPPS